MSEDGRGIDVFDNEENATYFRLCTVATNVVKSTGGERPQNATRLFSLF